MHNCTFSEFHVTFRGVTFHGSPSPNPFYFVCNANSIYPVCLVYRVEQTLMFINATSTRFLTDPRLIATMFLFLFVIYIRTLCLLDYAMQPIKLMILNGYLYSISCGINVESSIRLRFT